jgi:hypothetical protein
LRPLVSNREITRLTRPKPMVARIMIGAVMT